MDKAEKLPYTRTEMLDCMYACDADADGSFITGVLTTGIYCLPSCPARKPKAENVLFFRTEQKAQAAGLRPCKRCRPDNFYAQVDPDREIFLGLVEALKLAPAAPVSIATLAQHNGIGSTKLYELVARFAGTTPGELIHRHRIACAEELLAVQNMRVAEAAFEVGYASLSTFYQRFKQFTGSTPARYRKAAIANPEPLFMKPA